MPGNMSKEDAPSRGASLTFTIDHILNLKQRGGQEFDASKERKDKGCTEDLQAWDVRRRRDSTSEETGKGDLKGDVEKKQGLKCYIYIPASFTRVRAGKLRR